MNRFMLLFCSLTLIQCICAQIIKFEPPQVNVNKKSNSNDRNIQPEEQHIIVLKDDNELKKQETPHIKTEPHKINIAVNTTGSAHQQKKQNDVQPQNDVPSQNDTIKSNISNAVNNNIPNVGRAHFQKDSTQYGPLLRGFYVFISLSALVLIYLVFRSYRIRRNKQSSVKVKKYGVVTRRNDIEMRRLELEEDDDDENLFDIEQHRTK